MTVIVYGREGCYACKATTRQLERLSIPHRYRDIESDESARTVVESSGKTTLPMVDVTDNMELLDRWHGLRPERICKLVNSIPRQ